jgi:hypothetical protein
MLNFFFALCRATRIKNLKAFESKRVGRVVPTWRFSIYTVYKNVSNRIQMKGAIFSTLSGKVA